MPSAPVRFEKFFLLELSFGSSTCLYLLCYMYQILRISVSVFVFKGPMPDSIVFWCPLK